MVFRWLAQNEGQYARSASERQEEARSLASRLAIRAAGLTRTRPPSWLGATLSFATFSTSAMPQEAERVAGQSYGRRFDRVVLRIHQMLSAQRGRA